jgi:hypothetical protein
MCERKLKSLVRPRYAHVTLATGLNLLLRMPANADSGKSPPLITFGFFKEVELRRSQGAVT